MKRLQNVWKRYASDLVLGIGAGTVAAGVGMIYLPAGVITAGLLIIAGAVLAIRGEEHDHEPE